MSLLEREWRCSVAVDGGSVVEWDCCATLGAALGYGYFILVLSQFYSILANSANPIGRGGGGRGCLVDAWWWARRGVWMGVDGDGDGDDGMGRGGTVRQSRWGRCEKV